MQFPKSTVLNRFFAKERFYKQEGMSTALMESFQADISKITLTHALNPNTLNISAPNNTEILVFELQLKHQSCDLEILKHIGQSTSHYILFLLKIDGFIQAITSHNATHYFTTSWQLDSDLDLKIQGNSTTDIYQNFIYQIKPDLKRDNLSFEQVIEVYEHNLKVEKEIKTLQNKMKKEPSISKKHELAKEISQLKSTIK